MKLSLVILISGNGSNLQAIIDAIESDTLDAKIKAVISNRADAFGLERAAKHNIQPIVIDHKQFSDRRSFDIELEKSIEQLKPNLVVMAGFMRILSPEFVRHFAGRLINIHPSLLPKYRGLNTHARVLEAGDSEHGVSIHFVTEELDGGPLIAQEKIPVLPNDTPESLEERIHQLEHRLYPAVLQRFASGELQLHQDNAV